MTASHTAQELLAAGSGAEFEPVRRKGRRQVGTDGNVRWRRRPPLLLEPDADGRVSTTPLNAEFDSLYLEDETKPRWIAKPAVAYLWARTVRCGGCRAEIPLLKTRWLCKKDEEARSTHPGAADGRQRRRLGHRTAPDQAGQSHGEGTAGRRNQRCTTRKHLAAGGPSQARGVAS